MLRLRLASSSLVSDAHRRKTFRLLRTAARAARTPRDAALPALPLESVFAQLRSMTPPCDASHLADLATAAAAHAEQMSAKQMALLAHRFGDLQWHSKMVCEVLAQRSQEVVKDLLVAEWLAILRYFVNSGSYHEPLWTEAADWLREHSATLRFRHMTQLAVALAQGGHLKEAACSAILTVLQELPPEVDQTALLQLAVALALSGADRPQFFQAVLRHVHKLMSPQDRGQARIHLLLLLAQAQFSEASLVLSLVRGMEMSAVKESLPITAVAPLVRQLHRAALRQEAALLDARPLAVTLAKMATKHTTSIPVSDLPAIAAGLGFLGLDDVDAYAALWQHAILHHGDDGTSWESALRGDVRALRFFGPLAWASLVPGRHVHAAAAAKPLQPQGGPSSADIMKLLHAASPSFPGLQRHTQMWRQIAATAAAGTLGQVPPEAKANVEEWSSVPKAIFFSHRRQSQTRCIKMWKKHVVKQGFQCSLQDDASMDTVLVQSKAAVRKEPKEKLKARVDPSLRVALWVKHPLLIDAAKEDPSAVLGGRHVQNVCLSGFEGVEYDLWKCRPTALQLIILRSNASAAEVQAEADSFVQEHLLSKEQNHPQKAVDTGTAAPRRGRRAQRRRTIVEEKDAG